jgi:hypothetical protein
VDSEILEALSKDDLLALILAQQVQTEAQAAQIGALTARIAELEARLDAPRKTPGNSGLPPSKGRMRIPVILNGQIRVHPLFWCSWMERMVTGCHIRWSSPEARLPILSHRILPLIPADLVVVQVLPTPDRVTILTAPKPPRSACPLCGGISGQIHSHYTRTLADLPWQGRAVIMAWQKASGYTKRARAETAMARFKQVIGDGLRSHTDERL